MGAIEGDSDRPPGGRATRYPIQISMLYRSPGTRQWREARTENISRSGVLFRTNHLMPLQTPIEMLLALPVEVGGGQNATVICRGRVVRMAGTADDDTQRAVAATISGYRLTHSHVDPRRV
jgi:hypothetical protein